MAHNSEQWKSVPLTSILTKDQLAHVEDIFKRAIHQRESEQQLATALKAYLNTIAKELEPKGILPDFLAYSLIARAKGIT